MYVVALHGTVPGKFAGELGKALKARAEVVPERAIALLRTARRADSLARRNAGPGRTPALSAVMAEVIKATHGSGYRLNPADQEPQEAETVVELFDAAVRTGEHAVNPSDWPKVRGILARSGENGLVMILEEPGRPASIMQWFGKDEVWKVVLAPDGLELHPGVPINELAPRRVIAFDNCGSLLTGEGGPLTE